jgi:predicted nuclease of restriction endonuclease-like (RecB) superfamily
MQDFEPLAPLSGNASLSHELTPLLTHIAAVIQQSRQQVHLAVNSAMVQCYWQIGRLIVEHEQQGQARAAYGKQQMQALSEQLTAEFGKGFDTRNLRNMRSFFLAYPNWNAVRTELSSTHYRLLLRLDNLNARSWYQQEAIEQHWSARVLERQIGKLYYERLLSSRDKAAVQAEAERKITEIEPKGGPYARNPEEIRY